MKTELNERLALPKMPSHAGQAQNMRAETKRAGYETMKENFNLCIQFNIQLKFTYETL